MSFVYTSKADFHLSSARFANFSRFRFGAGTVSCPPVPNPLLTQGSKGADDLKPDVFERPEQVDTMISWEEEKQRKPLFTRFLRLFKPSDKPLNERIRQRIALLSGHKKLIIRGAAVDDNQKMSYIQQLLKLRERAEKAQKMRSNPSSHYYGTTLEMMNGKMYSAINTEADAETTHCDLRNATILALLDQSESESRIKQSAKMPSAPRQELPESKHRTAKTLFLVNADFHGEPPIPCSDCQNWMTTPIFSPDTKVVSLEKEQQSGVALMRIRTVVQMLPLHKGRAPTRMTTTLPLDSLPILESDSVQHTQKAVGQRLSEKQIRDLVQLAHNKAAHSVDFKKFPAAGVAVLLEGRQGSVTEGMGSRHWSRTYHVPFDECCVAEAESKYWKQSVQPEGISDISTDQPTLRAIAYYGDESKLPPIKSLGHLIRRQAPGTLNTLILTVEDDAIHCRTISDFMTEAYKAEKMS